MCIPFFFRGKPYLEPETSIYKRLFQLDDSKSLHGKRLFHQTSIKKWLFGVPGIRLTKLINTDPKEHLVVVSKDICTSNSSREKSSLGRDGHQLWGRVFGRYNLIRYNPTQLGLTFDHCWNTKVSHGPAARHAAMHSAPTNQKLDGNKNGRNFITHTKTNVFLACFWWSFFSLKDNKLNESGVEV